MFGWSITFTELNRTLKPKKPSKAKKNFKNLKKNFKTFLKNLGFSSPMCDCVMLCGWKHDHTVPFHFA